MDLISCLKTHHLNSAEFEKNLAAAHLDRAGDCEPGPEKDFHNNCARAHMNQSERDIALYKSLGDARGGDDIGDIRPSSIGDRGNLDAMQMQATETIDSLAKIRPPDAHGVLPDAPGKLRLIARDGGGNPPIEIDEIDESLQELVKNG